MRLFKRKPKLTYAYSKCPCGERLAYKQGDNAWDCSGILLGTADKKVTHTDRLPFVFWKIREDPNYVEEH